MVLFKKTHFRKSLLSLEHKWVFTAWMTATVLDYPGKVGPNMPYILKQINQWNKTETTQNQTKTNNNNKKGGLV